MHRERVRPQGVDTNPHDSTFLRAARDMTRFRSHLNACSGSSIYRRKKLAGERALPYEDVVALIVAARAEGAKRGRGADMACILLNAIVRDSLPPDAIPDVVVRPTTEPPPPAAPCR